ncbi:MAG: hypothetical protein SF069_11050 [Phycisphaerae bacterium]|nr:hypothetical protein [Phycisphaerae bacterium]
MKNATRAGGPASIGGYRYQMLWSLRHVLKNYVAQFTRAAKPDLIILEPAGGDLHSIGDARLVDQVKSRSTKASWSWREIVRAVLPDLYSVADDPDRQTRYRFITNGRIGPTLATFRMLSSPHSPSQQAVDAPAVDKGTHLDALVDEVVTALADSKKTDKTELDRTRERVRHILVNFECIGEQHETDIEQEVDALLLGMVTYHEQVSEKRNALLSKLEALAAQGNQSVRCEELLASIGVKAQPLSWNRFRSKAQEALENFIKLVGYEKPWDARNQRPIIRHISAWPNDQPVLVLSGESGQGKSWQLCRLALELSGQPALVVALQSHGSYKGTLDEVGRILWSDIAGHDAVIDLRQIAHRVRKLCPTAPRHWLTILIDQVNQLGEASSLARFDWAKLGVRALLACNSELAHELSQTRAVSEAAVISVGDFSLSELHRYLSLRLGNHWPNIPSDVQNVLRRPLLAKVYCDRWSADPAWQPTNEYELFDHCWQQLLRPSIAQAHLVRPKLASLAFELVRYPAKARYPWAASDLAKAEMTDPEINGLIERGWLRQTRDQCYEMQHDRLLNWAAAVGAVEAVVASDTSCDEMVRLTAALRAQYYVVQNRGLQYFLLDALWLLLNQEQQTREVVQRLLILIEQHDPRYEGAIRTLAGKLAPAMEHRLRTLADGPDAPPPYLIDAIASCIAHFGADVSLPIAKRLLGDTPVSLVRAAQVILARHPSAELLPDLWKLDRLLIADGDDHSAGDVSRRALAACAQFDPNWLPEQVEASADDPEDLVRLADICFELGDPTIWGRVRSTLLSRCGPDGEYLLALLIDRNRDASALSWLLERVQHPQPFTRCAVFCALSMVDPKAAIEVLPTIGPMAAAQLRRDGIASLLVHHRDAAMARLAEVLSSSQDPLSWALALQGMENSLSPTIVDGILDAYASEIERRIRVEPPARAIECWPALMFLSRVYRSDLLRCLESRRDSALGLFLRDGLLERAARSNLSVDPLDEYAFCILRKLGGAHFVSVVQARLRSESRYGRLDGIQFAHECPSDTTASLLLSICMRTETADGFPLEQHRATRALALLGEWGCVIQSVLRWGDALTRGLAELREKAPPLDDTMLAEAFAAIAERAANLPNAVLAVGVAGRRDYLPTIRRLLSDAELESDLARACLLAVDDLRDDSADMVRTVERHLCGKYSWLAACPMLKAGSPESLDILQRHLETSYSTNLAANLLQFEAARVEAARAIWKECQRPQSPLDSDLLIDSLGLLQQDACHEYLRERAFAAEGAFWIVGSKIHAIRGLSQYDKKAAIAAARKAVVDTTSHDRHDYPRLLMELDPTDSPVFLRSIAESESSEPVLSAIGHAIPAECAKAFVLAWLRSGDARSREVGCRMAKVCAFDCELIDAELVAIDKCAQPGLASSPRDALRVRESHRHAVKLREEYQHEQNGPRKWLLFDAACYLGDLGPKGQSLPGWLFPALWGAPGPVLDVLRERVESLRGSKWK